MLDMDNYLFCNIDKVAKISVSKINLKSSKENVIGNNLTSHSSFGFLKANAILEHGKFSNIASTNLLLKGSLFFVNYIQLSTIGGSFSVNNFTSIKTRL